MLIRLGVGSLILEMLLSLFGWYSQPIEPVDETWELQVSSTSEVHGGDPPPPTCKKEPCD